MPEPRIEQPPKPILEMDEKERMAYYFVQQKHLQEVMQWFRDSLAQDELASFGALLGPALQEEEDLEDEPEEPERPDTMPEDMWFETSEYREYLEAMKGYWERREASHRLTHKLRLDGFRSAYASLDVFFRQQKHTMLAGLHVSATSLDILVEQSKYLHSLAMNIQKLTEILQALSAKALGMGLFKLGGV